MGTYLPSDQITFDNIVTFANEEVYNNASSNTIGSIRYNATEDRFEGYHNNPDVDNNYWRPLTQDIATTTKYGVFKVGSNLIMNESTGYLSSIVAGATRLKQLIITVSPQSEGGDYTTINDAISNVIGTVSGGYRDGSLTQASNLNAAPNASNSFVVLVSPGIYTISNQIILPDYVSLRGEGKNQVVLQQTNSSSDTIANSAVIKIGTNSSVTDLTIRLNPNNTSNICGIYANSNSDIFVNNVLVEDTGTSATSNCYGMYITGGSNIIVNNYETNFTLGSTDIYGLYSRENKIEINNSKITIEADGNTNNYGLYLSNCNLIEDRSVINNNFLNVSGGTNNYGIYLSNSSARIQYTNVDAIDETSGRSSYGIALRGESSTAYIQMAGVISFTHSDSEKDTINSSNTSLVNFVTLGFTRGQGIKITGATNSINNGYFTIFNVTSSTITLIEQDILATEASGASTTITLQELFLVNLSYSHIDGTTNSIKSLDSNGSYQVETNYCILEGGNPDLGTDNILFTHNHVITVAQVGGDYNLVSSALDSILHNTEKNRYLIKILPGEYIESSALTTKEYVTIAGSGRESTIIKFNNKNSTLASGGGITLTSNVDITDITVKNITTGTSADTSFVLYGVGNSSSDKLQNVNLRNLNVISSGVASTQYGIYMKYCNYVSNNIDIEVTGASSSSSTNYGWYHEESGFINRNPDIQMSGGPASSKNVGMSLKKSDVNIYDSNISVQGSTTANYGVETIEETTNYNIVQFFAGKISAPATSGTNYSVINGSTITNYLCVLNGIHVVGEAEDNSSDGRKLVCNNCYEITSANVYRPLNIRGQTEENTNNSLTLGYTAGKIDMIGEYNTFIGVNSGQNITTGDKNTFVGYNSGKNTTTGSENTYIGHNTGMNTTTALNNIAIGSNAGMHIISAKDNIHIGRGSGLENTAGQDNITIGSNAGQIMQEGNRNILVGYKAGVNMGDTADNVVVGSNAGYNITTGGNNTIIGQSAGYNLTTGSNVVAVGDKAGYNNTASDNVMVGSYSGYNNTTGTNNFFMGYKTGFHNTTGSRNIYFGNKAGYSSTSGINNVLIGSEAGYSITTGSKNILIGSKTSDSLLTNDAAGWSITTGNLNIAIGSQSGKSLTTARNNVLIGVDSASSLSTGSDNIMIGRSTGATGITTASQNIFIGSCAGVNATRSNNIFIGNNSGANSTGIDLILIGNRSGQTVIGNRNMFVGYQSGFLSTTSGTDNLCMGIHTGYSLSTGSRNIIFGTGDTSRSAGRQISSGSDNVLMGFRAGGSIRSANENVYIGSNAGGLATSSKNVAIGTESGESGVGQLEGTQYVGGNINIGHQAGKQQTSARYNLNMGYQAGYSNTEGEYNVNLGYQAGYTGVVNDNNIHIGYQAGYQSIADNNVLIGYQAGYTNTSSNADYNLFIGYQAGYQNTSGQNNMFIGSNAGLNSTLGNKNVFIGNNAGKGTSIYHVINTILIGPNAGLNNLGNNSVYIGSATDDDKGIGYQATANAVKNMCIGVDSGISITDGKQNIAIGVNCLENVTTGSNNSGFGVHAGKNITTGSNNIVMGNEAGKTITTGEKNLFIGNQAGGRVGGTVSYNVAIGDQAGKQLQTSNIIAIGSSAGKSNTTGTNNFYIGENAGKLNTTSSDNLIIGSNAGKNLVSGNGQNIFMGSSAGLNNETGFNNLVIGHNSLRQGTSTSNTVIIGHDSGRNITTGINNIGVGINSLYTNTTGSDNICIGYQTGFTLNSSNCILIGKQTGRSITTGNDNIGFGTDALYYTTTGSNNNAIGYQALYNNTTGSRNFAIGYESLNGNRTRNDNFAIGYQSGKYFGITATSANEDGNNMFFGYRAGLYNNGSNNVFLGYGSGKSASSGAGDNYELNTGSNNVGIGINTLSSLTTGSNNTVIGGSNGSSLTTGNNNFIGGSSVAPDITVGSNNILFGHRASIGEREGNYNIYLGYYAGAKIDEATFQHNPSGLSYNPGPPCSKNIGIGIFSFGCYEFDGVTGKGEDNVCIGNYTMFRTASGYPGYVNSNLVINNVAIGTNAAYYNSGSNNTIVGYNAGYYCHGNNNVYIGAGAGNNNPYGSNNIIIATSSDNTMTYSNLSVTRNNIFAVYQDNALESGNPLLYGDLVNSTLAINNRSLAVDGSTLTTKLYVNGDCTANQFTPFTGAHHVNFDYENETVEGGHIMVSTGNVDKSKRLNTVVEVTKSTIEKEKTVYGIYVGHEIMIDNSNSNVSSRIDKVASVGEGTMLVCNIGGEIMNGDYICSSNIPGYGMKQDDDIVHNYTVAKSTQDVDWNSVNDVIEHNGVEYKKYLIGCTYHCG